MPSTLKPDAVTKKVITATSRSSVLANAAVRLLAIVPSKANPAMARTNSFGKAENRPTTVAPNNPVIK